MHEVCAVTLLPYVMYLRYQCVSYVICVQYGDSWGSKQFSQLYEISAMSKNLYTRFDENKFLAPYHLIYDKDVS